MYSLNILLILLLNERFYGTFASKCNYNCTQSSTNLEVFQDHILKRRIRAVIFPNKAQVLLTPAFTKAILGGRPRGLSYSVEFDMYHPLPDTIDGWKPTLLLNKVKQENKATQQPIVKPTAKAVVQQKPTGREKDTNTINNADIASFESYNPLEFSDFSVLNSFDNGPDESSYQGYSFPMDYEENDFNKWHRSQTTSAEYQNPLYFTK